MMSHCRTLLQHQELLQLTTKPNQPVPTLMSPLLLLLLPRAALYPIDTIKTRLQAMIGGGGFKALMSAGGGKGLYAGVWGNLAGRCHRVPPTALQ